MENETQTDTNETEGQEPEQKPKIVPECRPYTIVVGQGFKTSIPGHVADELWTARKRGIERFQHGYDIDLWEAETYSGGRVQFDARTLICTEECGGSIPSTE